MEILLTGQVGCGPKGPFPQWSAEHLPILHDAVSSNSDAAGVEMAGRVACRQAAGAASQKGGGKMTINAADRHGCNDKRFLAISGLEENYG